MLRTIISRGLLRTNRFVYMKSQFCDAIFTNSLCYKVNESICEMESKKIADALVWIDLEMTGLDVSTNKIMEIAVLITTKDLDIVAEGPDMVIKVDDASLNSMNEWCTKHHGQSGLTQQCRDSKISLEQAEDEVFKFVSQHTVEGLAPLAGNSIHADKKFLDKYMPKLMSHLHYRLVDVSTVKELCRRWYPLDYQRAPPKKGTHRSLEDIKASIEELKYYREAIFK